METDNKILKILLKDTKARTITYLAEKTKLTRTGIWKILKKLEKENLVLSNSIGEGKTSAYTVKLNWENVLVEKILNLSLTQEAIKQKRWISNFKELEKEADFLIIYGSILHSPKEANDVDIITVAKEKKLSQIGKIILKIQEMQSKKIHSINLTEKEFKQELKKGNKAYLDAVERGIILFGQENFIKFIKSLRT